MCNYEELFVFIYNDFTSFLITCNHLESDEIIQDYLYLFVIKRDELSPSGANCAPPTYVGKVVDYSRMSTRQCSENSNAAADKKITR